MGLRQILISSGHVEDPGCQSISIDKVVASERESLSVSSLFVPVVGGQNIVSVFNWIFYLRFGSDGLPV